MLDTTLNLLAINKSQNPGRGRGAILMVVYNASLGSMRLKERVMHEAEKLRIPKFKSKQKYLQNQNGLCENKQGNGAPVLKSQSDPFGNIRSPRYLRMGFPESPMAMHKQTIKKHQDCQK